MVAALSSSPTSKVVSAPASPGSPMLSISPPSSSVSFPVEMLSKIGPTGGSTRVSFNDVAKIRSSNGSPPQNYTMVQEASALTLLIVQDALDQETFYITNGGVWF